MKKYKTVSTQLTNLAFTQVVEQVFDEIGLRKAYIGGERNVFANKVFRILFLIRIKTNQLKVSYHGDYITIRSKTRFKWWEKNNTKLENTFAENYQILEKQFDNKDLDLLEESFQEWFGYNIPNMLPPFIKEPEVSILPLLKVCLGAAIGIGWLWAVLNHYIDFVYNFIGYHFTTSILLFQAVRYGQKKGQYANIFKINITIFLTIIMLLTCFEFFLYSSNINESSFGLALFDQAKDVLAVDFYYKSIRDVIDIWIMMWCIQIPMMYYFVSRWISIFTQSREAYPNIPEKVYDFVLFSIMKNQSDTEIRMQLAKKGWANQKEQDEAFRAME